MSTLRPNKNEIFNAAAEITDVDERLSYIATACGNDSALRAEIEELLKHDDAADSLLDRSAPGLGVTIGQPITEKPGMQIGPYKLLQQIGEGGMGVVYMAEQKQPVKRRVALKIIKPGLDTRQVIARFEAERQALAMMEHPNIARVLDGGETETGRPYFVMELVNGVPITQYCDEKHLSLRERLELFIPVCRAVQHAHQKGIIHRDLKPSNIMVARYDGHPVPKVIDFGVARAANQTLTDKTLFTQLGQIVGTLEYMSPEQAERNQLDIDTRSDVYSLGVVLYELLAGETPFDQNRLRSAAWDEMLRIIREEEPPKPSTRLSSASTLPAIAANRSMGPAKLGAFVRGELDWIVMKAMDKDRVRRYDTADAFAADIGNYLADDPVLACPPSLKYRLGKVVRRNFVSLSVAASVLLLLIAGIAGTASQARWALSERDRALVAESNADRLLKQEQHLRRRAERAEQTAESRLADVETARRKTRAALDEMSSRMVSDWLGSQEVLTDDQKKYLENSIELYEEFTSERGDDRDTVLGLAQAYIRIGHLQSLLGLRVDANAAFEKSTTLLRKAIADQRDDRELGLLLSNSLSRQSQHVEAQAVLERRLEKDPEDDECRQMLISCQISHSSQLRSERHFQQSLELLEDAQHHQEALLSKSQTAEHLNQLAIIHGNKGSVLLSMGAHEKASDEREKGIHLFDELLLQFPSNSNYQQTAVTYRLNRAMRLRDQGKYSEAESEFRSVMKMQLDLAQANPAIPKHRMRLGQIQINLCRLLIEENQLVDAERTALEAISGWTFLFEYFGIDYLTGLASSEMQLAKVYAAQEKYRDAIATITLAINHTEEAREELGLLVFIHENMLRTYGYRADWLMNLGRYSEAASDYREIIQIEDSAWNRGRLGIAYYRASKFDQAIEQYQKADGMLAGGDRAHRMFYAMALQQVGRTDEALQRYVEGAAWIAANRKSGEQIRLREEAEKLLGLDQVGRVRLIQAYYINHFPADANAREYYDRGKWFGQQGRHEEAIGSLTIAIEKDPNNAGFLHWRALQSNRQGNHQTALEDANRALEIDPKASGAHGERSWAHRQLGNLDQALADAEEAVKLSPKSAWAYRYRRDAFTAKADFVAALADAEKVAELEPQNANDFKEFADLSMKLNRWDEAANAYRVLLEKWPHRHWYWKVYCRFLVRAGKLDEYRAYCERLMAKHADSEDGGTIHSLVACLPLGPDAVVDWDAALQLVDRIPAEWQLQARSKLLTRAGRFDEALRLRQQLIDQRGESGANHDDLAWLCLLEHGRGNVDQARKHLSKIDALIAGDPRLQSSIPFQTRVVELRKKLAEEDR